MVLPNVDTSVKILLTLSTAIWNHEIKVLFYNYMFGVHYFMQVARNSISFVNCK